MQRRRQGRSPGTRLVVAVAFLAFTGSLPAQLQQRDEVRVANLAPSPLTQSTGFACAIAMSGDSMVVGAPRDDSRGRNSGVVLIYEQDGGVFGEPVILSASDAREYDFFGNAVAIDGDWIIVGAQGTSQQGLLTGSAFILERVGDSWIEQAVLEADMPMNRDLFGHAVAVSGNKFVVGARWKDELGTRSGAAYVFERAPNGSVIRSRLMADDHMSGDMLGESVAIDGDTIALGAWSADPMGLNSGAVYVFKHDGVDWKQEAKVTASDGAAFDNFGAAIDLRGDLLLIGAEGDDDRGEDSGSAYLFERNGGTWSEAQKLTGSDGAAGDHFGQAVALGLSSAFVSAPGKDGVQVDAGAVYRFLRPASTWVEDSQAVGGQEFGKAIAIDGDLLASSDSSGLGSLRVFDPLPGSLSELAEIEAISVGGAGVNFGSHVALAGEMLLAADADAMVDSERGLIQVQSKHNPGFAQQIIGSPPGSAVIGGDLAVDGSLLVASSGNSMGGAWLFERRGGGYVLSRDLGTLSALRLWSAVDSTVTVSERRFALGMPNATVQGRSNSGVVILYERDSLFGWQTASVLPGGANEHFGSALAMHGDWMAIASGYSSAGLRWYHYNERWRLVLFMGVGLLLEEMAMDAALAVASSPSTGEVAVFELVAGSWSFETILSIPDGVADRFGASVDVLGGVILVGAPEDDEIDTDRGAVYVYEKSAGIWTQVDKIHPAEAMAGSLFGTSLAMSEGLWAVGAPGNNNSGTVHLFSDPAYELSFGDGCGGDFGVPLLLPLSGQTPAIGTTFEVELTRLPPASFTLGLLGFSRTNMLGLTLPYALADFAPGCLIHGSAELRTVLDNQTGTATWSIDIPDNPNLIGLRVYMQGISIDSEANLIGWVLSNGLQPRMLR